MRQHPEAAPRVHTYTRGRDAVHAASRPFVCRSATVPINPLLINPLIADTYHRHRVALSKHVRYT